MRDDEHGPIGLHAEVDTRVQRRALRTRPHVGILGKCRLGQDLRYNHERAG